MNKQRRKALGALQDRLLDIQFMRRMSYNETL